MNLNNPYLKEYNEVMSTHLRDDLLNMGLRYRMRGELVKKYAWAVPDSEAIEIIKKYGPIVEIGAGTGYWAYLMRQVGIHVKAYDKNPYKNHYLDHRWSTVNKGGVGKTAFHSDKALFLCWPPYDTLMAYYSLIYYRGNTVIYVGESNGGCTGDDLFHEELHANWEEIEEYRIPQWDAIHDRLTVYKRKTSK